MPQMMPMLWTFMFMSMILLTFITISIFFFSNLPSTYSPELKSTNPPQWSWTW